MTMPLKDQEYTVSKLDRSMLILAAGALSAGLVMCPAYAFNPQPDPPAKRFTASDALKQKNGTPAGWRSVSPGLCKTGSSCQLAPRTGGRLKTGQ